MKGDCRNWEVGSTWFGCPDEVRKYGKFPSFRANGNQISFLSTCRSAIEEILSNIEKRGNALVPAFTCHSVIEPFLNKGYEVYGYPLNDDLTIDWSGFMKMVEEHKPSVVLIHGYFGLNNTSNCDIYIKKIKDAGIVVIEDMTQNMFSSFPDIKADFQVGSIRKWFPVPDGAFLNGIPINNLGEDAELSEAKSEAMLAKQDYIFRNKGEKGEFMRRFSEAENLLDSRKETFAISKKTLDYLWTTDLKELNNRRRENYELLTERFSIHKELQIVKSELSDNEVPFMLPVFIKKNRSEFQKYMAEHKVYPTIIWKCPEELEPTIDTISKNIYDTILCFHIDQRYDTDDMNKVADIVDSYFNRANNE